MKKESPVNKRMKGAIYETSSLYLEPMAPVTFSDANKMIGKKIVSISAKEGSVSIKLEDGNVIRITGDVDISLIKKN
jgi:hypothetical protein